MSYYDEQPQASDPLSNPRVVTAIVLAIAGLIAIVGCVGLYFFIGGRSAGQPTLVVAVTSLPTNTPSLTPVPSETPEPTTTPGPNDISTTLASPTTEGFGGGGGPRYATLSEIRGLVEYKNDTVGDWKAATSEVSVPAGTSIRTSESSSVKLTLNEGTVIRVSSQTQFTLSQLTGDDADPTTTLTLDFGKIWNIVVTTPGTTTYEVITPYGKASVRGSFMSTEHNSTEELDIITCLESVKGCSYSVDGVGVQGLATGQMLIYKQGDSLASPEKMDQGQLNDWAPTKVPEVLTLTPTATTTGTITPSRTPTITRTPSNTPNREATSNSGGTKTSIAATSTALAGANSGTQTQAAINQTATQNSGNLTATVYFFNVTATALFQSTQNSFTATSFSFTATAFAATSNANATNSSFTQTAQAASATSGVLTATWVSTIATATAASTNATATSAALTATQNAIPIFSFYPLATSVPESAGQVTLTVNVSVPNNAANMTVDYTFGSGTALGGGALGGACSGSGPVDYNNTGGTVIFTPGSTSQTIVVPIADDGCNAVDASTEYFQATLSNPVNPSGPELLGNSISTVTIVNVSPPSVSFSSGTFSVTEGNSGSSNASITVNLLRAYANTTTVTVNYSTFAGGTATDGACGTTGIDYNSSGLTDDDGGSPGVLNFPPGVTTRTISLPVCGDTMNEANETVFLQLTTPANATLGTASATLTITDNDPVPSITLAVAPGATILEPDNPPTVVPLTFTANLSAASGQTVTVNYATALGTASGLDFTGVTGTFTFIPGDTSESVTVNINADFIYEADETFDFTLSSPSGATLGTPSSITITIQNDAANDPVPNAAFSLAPYSANEPATGSTNATVTVSLNRQSGETIVINYSTTNGTATGSAGCGGSTGRDYITTSGSLTYNPGELTKTFDIPVCADSIVEAGGESLTITISRNIAFGQVTTTAPTTQLWVYDP